MRIWVALVLALAALAAAAVAIRKSNDAPRLRGTVVHVVDGDTLDVRVTSSRRERIRVLGIDTPEQGECFFARASRAARRLALGQSVVLETDATQARRDAYGRLLAYVRLPHGRDLGRELLAAGLARVYVYERPFERVDAYRDAERAGRAAAASIWRRCADLTVHAAQSAGA